LCAKTSDCATLMMKSKTRHLLWKNKQDA